MFEIKYYIVLEKEKKTQLTLEQCGFEFRGPLTLAVFSIDQLSSNSHGTKGEFEHYGLCDNRNNSEM